MLGSDLDGKWYIDGISDDAAISDKKERLEILFQRGGKEYRIIGPIMNQSVIAKYEHMEYGIMDKKPKGFKEIGEAFVLLDSSDEIKTLVVYEDTLEFFSLVRQAPVEEVVD